MARNRSLALAATATDNGSLAVATATTVARNRSLALATTAEGWTVPR